MYVLEQGSANFSVKIVNVLGFVGYRVHCSYSALLLQHECSCREFINKSVWPCFSKTLCMNTES